MTDRPDRRAVVTRLAAAFAAAAFSATPTVARSDEHVVEISRFKFSPAGLSVKACDVVTWINRDIAPHTATALDGSWDTGRLDHGESRRLVIEPGMTTSYYCRFHPMMKSALQLT